MCFYLAQVTFKLQIISVGETPTEEGANSPKVLSFWRVNRNTTLPTKNQLFQINLIAAVTGPCSRPAGV
jgi:hypothetical protein